jgi:hypothetical protein
MDLIECQRLRTLESDYLKMRWKINKYEKLVSMLDREKHSGDFIERTSARLSFFRVQQEEIWDMIRSFYK